MQGLLKGRDFGPAPIVAILGAAWSYAFPLIKWNAIVPGHTSTTGDAADPRNAQFGFCALTQFNDVTPRLRGYRSRETIT